jgi:ELWxxDGT repeat protein
LRSALLSLLLTSLLVAPAVAAPHLVKDLNTGPAIDPLPSFSIGITNTEGFTVFADGILYFSAFDPAHGDELWRSDGTDTGTYRLTDICPGRCDSRPIAIAVSQSGIFVSATDGVTGYELWRSDGTPGSERRVRDLCVGPCNGSPVNLQDLNGILLFTASDGQAVRLWRSNGSRRGTTAIATLCPLSSLTNGTQCAFGMRRVGDRVVFSVEDPTTFVTDLWTSDGTAAGTGPLGARIAGGLPHINGGAVVNGSYAFFLSQYDLWRTDGTPAGTFRVKELQQLVDITNLQSSRSVIWNGALYLFLDTVLVRSDGTNLGTVRLNAFPHIVVNSFIVPLDDVLLFVTDGPGGSQILWRMDANGAAEKIFELAGTTGFINDITPLGDQAVFRIKRSNDGPYELWVTDGTSAGTRQIAGVPLGTYAFEMFSTGTEAFYPIGDYPSPKQLWKTDGTEAGTVLVHDFAAGPGSSGPLAQAALGNALIFSAQTAEREVPLFRSDGTAAGTRVLSAQASYARDFAQLGNRLFFASSKWGVAPGTDIPVFAANGLWTTNGGGGTLPVAPQIVSYKPFGTLGNRLLFAGGNSVPSSVVGPDVELWSSDGGNTRRIKAINPFQIGTGFHHICVADSSNPGPGVAIGNGRFVFAAEDGVNGRELWVTDGTAAGTRLVLDINPQRSPFPPASDCDDRETTGLSSNPTDFVAFRGGAIFVADDGVHGRELWITNGTRAGTRQLRDLRPGAQSSALHDLTAFRNAVYFVASAQGNGEALWRTDGTSGGTVLVDDLKIGGTPSWATSLTVAGNQLFFAGTNESTGPELWASRGDAASTRLVADLRPGAPGSYPQELTAVGNVILFAATDGEHGLEPWRSDGTAAGTVPLGDLNPGLDASSPGPFTRAGSSVFTGAYDAAHGRELWAIPVAEVVSP